MDRLIDSFQYTPQLCLCGYIKILEIFMFEVTFFFILTGANKTEKAAMRACVAADTCVSTCRSFDHYLGIPKLSQNHTTKSSTKDLELLKKTFRQIKPFNYMKGRSFEHFLKIQKNPKTIVGKEELLRAVKKKSSGCI